MKIKWGYILAAVLAIIAASNIVSAYLYTLTESTPVLYAFETRSAEFEFVVDPGGGTDVALMEAEFRKFLHLNPQTPDRELFRTFERNPWKFWNWYRYLTSELYDYPYKDPALKP